MNKILKLILILALNSNYFFSKNNPVLSTGVPQKTERGLSDSEKKLVNAQLKTFTKDFIANNQSTVIDASYIIPIVVHVIHNFDSENISYEQVYNALSRLNEDFQGLNDDLYEVVEEFVFLIGSTSFEFRLATIDPDGNCTYGVNRVASPMTSNTDASEILALTNWDDQKYVNIYIVRDFQDSQSATAAFTVNPGGGSEEYGDYIFFRYDYFGDWNVSIDNGPTGNQYKRHVATHEMGHFMNLINTWGPTNDAAYEDNCYLDDGVEDTPETIGTLGGCPTSQATCDGQLDNVQNFMDNSNCACMFTQGQVSRMETAVNSLAGNRWFLWQESNLIATGTNDDHWSNSPYSSCAPIPDFKASETLLCSGSQLFFTDFTYNYQEENISYNWIFEGGTPQSSNIKNPIIEYLEPGVYDVSLTTCNGENCNSITIDDHITVISEVNIEPGEVFSQNFETFEFPNINNEIWWNGFDSNEQHWELFDLDDSQKGIALRIKSENYGSNRNSHEFCTPEIELSQISYVGNGGADIWLSFDYAYATRLPYISLQINNQGEFSQAFPIHYDELIISYKQCDYDQWVERPKLTTRPGYSGFFLNQQENIITTSELHQNNFIPESNEWSNYMVNLNILNSQLESNPSIIIKFEFRGTGKTTELYSNSNFGPNDFYTLPIYGFDYCNNNSLLIDSIGGNWLYIDNIRLGTQENILNFSNVSGCTDYLACNFNSGANNDDGSCEYPLQYYNCYGICLNDVDCDNVCDELDNCPWIYNVEQNDSDGDGLGDDCDFSPLELPNYNLKKNILVTFDVLGKNFNKNKFKLNIYDDGSVEKIYNLTK